MYDRKDWGKGYNWNLSLGDYLIYIYSNRDQNGTSKYLIILSIYDKKTRMEPQYNCLFYLCSKKPRMEPQYICLSYLYNNKKRWKKDQN